MPTYFARKTGNINAADIWASTPGGTASAVTFSAGDVLVANSFTITVNVSTNLGASGEVRNDTTGGATLGGSFVLTDGVTLTANAIFGNTTTTLGVNYAGTTSATLIGNITVNSGRGGHSGIGTLNFVGNISGANALNTAGFYITGGGTLNVTGNLFGGSLNASAYALWTTSTVCTINITGNVTGGALGTAINNTNNSAINITGNVTGGTGVSAVAITNSGASNLVIVNGQVIGGTQAAGINNTSTGTIRCTRVVGNAYGPGNTAGLTAQPGIANSGLGVIEIEQIEYGTFGQSPVSGTGIRLKKANTNVAVFNYADTAGAKTLIDATQNAAMPAATDVRSGVSYASGALTGSAFIPSPSSVASGVPVDATTGTAVLTLANVQSALTAQGLTTARAGALDNLDTTVSSRLSPSGTLATVTNLTNAPASVTPSDIWSHASRTITGGTVDTLTNAPSVPTPSQIASQVRTELSVELARVDQNISSRLASSAYTAPANSDITAIKAKTDNLPASPAATGDIPSANIAAIKAKTDLLNTDRLAQVSTVATTGAQLAAALS